MNNYIIVSYNGYAPVGGVERVTYYLKNILSFDNSVFVMSQDTTLKTISRVCYRLAGKRIGQLLLSVIISILLIFYSKKKVISHGFYVCLYPSDYVFAHGTARGLVNQLSKNVIIKKRSFHLTSFVEKLAMKHAKNIIAVSHDVKNELINNYNIDPTKIHVVINAVDTEIFNDTGRTDERIILYVGRIERAKGEERLFDLIKNIKSSDWKIIIASPNEDDRSKVDSSENCIFMNCNSQEDMAALYKRASVLFVPSYYEGFSLAVIEALSCGVPVMGHSIGLAFMTDLATLVPDSVMHYDQSTSYLEQVNAIHETFTTEKRTMLSEKCKKVFSLSRYTKELKNVIK